MNNESIRDIEISIEEAKKAIAMGEALARLERNKDFKKVITEGLCHDFAVQCVSLRGNTGFRMNENLMASNTRKLDMIGELVEYFRNVHANAAMMTQTLADAEAEQVNMIAGE